MADDELTRKIGKAIVVVTTPDVCKAPTVPTPFVSYSKFDLSIKTADTVRMTSCVSFTKESRLSMTMADQGGVGGGVKSQVFGGMCRPFKGWSSTVRAQGSEICRHDVIMEVNCAGPEGPGNTFGKVIYVESLCCASITPAGEIVAEEPQDTKPVEDSGEGAPDKGKPSESGAGTSDEGGFGKEAGKRVQNEIDGLKQSGKDLYDLATSPEARQQAIDTAKETAEAAAKDPVGFGLEAGGEIINDATEPFETAGGQLSKGDIGGAAASAGYGILNIFNPFKKLKILEKVGKLGKKKKKGKSDSDNDSKKDDKEEKPEKEEEKKSGDDGNATGEDGGTVTKAPVSPDDFVSEHAYEKHRYKPDKKSTKSSTQYGKDVDPKRIGNETMKSPDKVKKLYDAQGNHYATRYSKEFNTNISTPDTPTNQSRVIINHKDPSRSTQFPKY